MKTRDEIIAILASVLPPLRRRYPIGSVELFGSYGRDEQSEDSDVDLAVEFLEPMSYRSHVALEQELTRALGTRVDIVDRQLLKPRVRARVEREAVRI